MDLGLKLISPENISNIRQKYLLFIYFLNFKIVNLHKKKLIGKLTSSSQMKMKSNLKK